MKLQIKHLTPYLPYNLHFSSEGKVYELNEIQVHNKEYALWAISEWNEEKLIFEPEINKENIRKNLRGQGFKLEKIKPLLHPLENLLHDCPEEIRDEVSDEIWDAFVHRLEFRTVDPIIMIPVRLFLKMVELKYDVFRLIPQGLALDINTVVTK